VTNHKAILWPLVLLCAAAGTSAQTVRSIAQASSSESGQRTDEISTEQLRGVLADQSAVVLHARPFREYAISHIPDAVNVAAKPGVPMS
jgi:rhodanese-related sulfurtransferase